MSLAHFGGVSAECAEQIAECVFDTVLDVKKLMGLLQA